MGGSASTFTADSVTIEKIKEARSSDLPIYKLVDFSGGGELLDWVRSCRRSGDFSILDGIIEVKVGAFLYGNGKGKLIAISELVNRRNNERNAKLSRLRRNREKGKKTENILDQINQEEMQGDMMKGKASHDVVEHAGRNNERNAKLSRLWRNREKGKKTENILDQINQEEMQGDLMKGKASHDVVDHTGRNNERNAKLSRLRANREKGKKTENILDQINQEEMQGDLMKGKASHDVVDHTGRNNERNAKLSRLRRNREKGKKTENILDQINQEEMQGDMMKGKVSHDVVDHTGRNNERNAKLSRLRRNREKGKKTENILDQINQEEMQGDLMKGKVSHDVVEHIGRNNEQNAKLSRLRRNREKGKKTENILEQINQEEMQGDLMKGKASHDVVDHTGRNNERNAKLSRLRTTEE